MKKVVIILKMIIVIYIFLGRGIIVNSCAFHGVFPPTASDEYIDSYYYSFELDEQTQNSDYEDDRGIIFVVQTKNYVGIINEYYLIPGMFVIDYKQIESIKQSEFDDKEVVIKFVDGTEKIVNTIEQLSDDDNVFYIDPETNYFEVREEYQYLWGNQEEQTDSQNIEEVAEDNPSEVNVDNSINDPIEVEDGKVAIFDYIKVFVLMCIIIGCILVLLLK